MVAARLASLVRGLVVEPLVLGAIDQKIGVVARMLTGGEEFSSQSCDERRVRRVAGEVDRLRGIVREIEHLPAIDAGMPDHLPPIVSPLTVQIPVAKEHMVAIGLAVKVGALHAGRDLDTTRGEDRRGEIVQVCEVVADHAA